MHQNGSDGNRFCTFLVILRTWQNMIWKAFLLFGDLCSFWQFTVYICIKKAPTETVSLFFWVLELKLKKGSLEHVKTWLGRRFCCLVIYANLHNLPCICVKMAPTGTFFHFLVIVGIKGEKGSLAHDKTLFGRRFCCLVIYANLHNLPCICIF